MPKNIPTIAITGANGFLGSALTTYFSQKGWQVIGLVRSPKKSKLKNVSYRRYDLNENPSNDLLKGVDYLVHAAYTKEGQLEEVVATNIQAAKSLIKLSRQSKLKRNVFISSMSAHKEAISAYGQQKLAIEKIFNLPKDICLRPGLIIGNGGLVKTMVGFMKKWHAVPLIGGGKQPLQYIGINDLLLAIDKSLTSKQGGVLTIAHPKVYNYADFYKTIARELKIKVLFVPIPYHLLLAVIKVAQFLHLPMSINDSNIKGLRMLRSFNTQADLKKLKLKPQTLSKLLESF